MDATRGYCVAAVVLYHVVLWHVADLESLAPAGSTLWAEVNSVLGSARMPMLMAASGLVLSRQIRQGLHRSTTVFRAASNYYLYAVWLAVYAVFSVVVRSPSVPHRVDGWDVVVQLVAPDTTLWYIFGLAVYIPVLAAVRRAPPWLVLVLLAGVSVAVRQDGVLTGMWEKVPELFVFFATGVYAAPALRRLAETATVLRVAVAGAGALGLTLVARLVPGELGGSVMFLAKGAAFVVVAVLAVSIAVRWGPVRSVGVLLGRHALAIYVLHPLLLAVVLVLVAGSLADPLQRLVGTTPGSVLYPVVTTIAVVLAAVGLQGVAERVRMGFLFGVPRPVRAAFGRP